VKGSSGFDAANILLNASCDASWRSPTCDSVDVAGGENWIVQYSDELLSVDCMTIVQHGDVQAQYLELWSCQTWNETEVTDSWKKHCLQMKNTKQGQSNHWGVSVDVIRASKDVSLFSASTNLVSIAAVLSLNLVIYVTTSQTAHYIRFRTVTDLAVRELVALFLAQLVNTGLLVVLVSMRLFVTDFSLAEDMKVGQGEHNDFTVRWFVGVGSGLFGTIVGQMITTTTAPLIWSFVYTPLYRWWYEETCATQRALNNLYELPEWDLPLRLAQTMSIIFCSLMYGGGMPLLYLVAGVYCFISYWLDKLCMLWGSKRPPQYNEEVICAAMHFFWIGALCHTVVTLTIFGNQNILPSDWSDLQSTVSGVIGISLQEYEEVSSYFSDYGPNIREAYHYTYFRARVLDCSRKSCVLLLAIFLCLVAYYMYIFVYFLVLKPCCTTLTITVRHLRKKKHGRSDNTEANYDEAERIARSKNMPFSYRLCENDNYLKAYEALGYTPTSDHNGPSNFINPLHMIAKFASVRPRTSKEGVVGAARRVWNSREARRHSENVMDGVEERALRMAKAGRDARQAMSARVPNVKDITMRISKPYLSRSSSPRSAASLENADNDTTTPRATLRLSKPYSDPFTPRSAENLENSDNNRTTPRDKAQLSRFHFTTTFDEGKVHPNETVWDPIGEEPEEKDHELQSQQSVDQPLAGGAWMDAGPEMDSCHIVGQEPSPELPAASSTPQVSRQNS